jgi:uncharacterized protein (DUF2336 family)
MTLENEDGQQRAFSTFRVLNGESEMSERDQLFRSMAQLYSHVSDRCDDEQVAQYDEVLCRLAALVEVEARAHVAKLLAPLDRAPGNVVTILAHDAIEVAAPLLEFSNVLSDDDLIEIVASRSESHRLAIAARTRVAERVGEAIAEFGGEPSINRLAANAGADLGPETLKKLLIRSKQDPILASALRGRTDIDWHSLGRKLLASSEKVLADTPVSGGVRPSAASDVNALVLNRIKNHAGFSAQEWKLAYNQVKALSDRRQLDERALQRFARFGYGHHIAAALTVMLGVTPEVFVKWLAMQDYVAVIVACKSLGLPPGLFENLVEARPAAGNQRRNCT